MSTADGFLQILETIASQDCDVNNNHDFCTMFARTTLAALSENYQVNLIVRPGLSTQDYAQVKFWLSVLASNRLTCNDRSKVSKQILHIYQQPQKQIEVAAVTKIS